MELFWQIILNFILVCLGIMTIPLVLGFIGFGIIFLLELFINWIEEVMLD